MPESDMLLSPLQAALILAVSPRTVVRWADDGTLHIATRTAGGQRRFNRDDVEALAAERAEEVA
jgi:excisionase family DNA binding protein